MDLIKVHSDRVLVCQLNQLKRDIPLVIPKDAKIADVMQKRHDAILAELKLRFKCSEAANNAE